MVEGSSVAVASGARGFFSGGGGAGTFFSGRGGGGSLSVKAGQSVS